MKKKKKVKTHTIVPEMMRVGQFVIVKEWRQEDAPTIVYGARPRPIGMPVKILALALPLMVVEYCAIKGLRGIMDARQVAEFTRVPSSYVKALVPAYGKKVHADGLKALALALEQGGHDGDQVDERL